MTPTQQELRELDEFIAKHVMGWKFITAGTFPHNDIAGVPPTTRGLHHPVPKYSTDPAAAFEVLRKCSEKCVLTIETTNLTNTGVIKSFVCKLVESHIGKIEVETTQEITLELAICKFAQKLFSK